MTSAPRRGTEAPRRLPASKWSRLLTESRNPRSLQLDSMSSERVVGLLLAEDRLALLAAAKKTRPIAAAARLVADAFTANGRTIFVGAGTSGRLGILEAAECPPTFGTAPERIVGIMAGGEDAVFRAKEGSEDRGDDGERVVADVGPRDVVVGISASSVTPFVRGALAVAKKRRAKTVLVTCAPQAGLGRLADVVIAVRTGPEVLTGSTRLKAGSATKAVLNAITTAAMVRVGKAYTNFMVDLRQTSKKLEDRARRIVALAASVDLVEADRLVRAADNEVKTAIVMGLLGVEAAEARRRLAAGGGHIRRTLPVSRRR